MCVCLWAVGRMSSRKRLGDTGHTQTQFHPHNAWVFLNAYTPSLPVAVAIIALIARPSTNAEGGEQPGG